MLSLLFFFEHYFYLSIFNHVITLILITNKLIYNNAIRNFYLQFIFLTLYLLKSFIYIFIQYLSRTFAIKYNNI